MTLIGSLFGALVADAASAKGLVIASALGAAVAEAVQAVGRRRLEGARDILVEEVRFAEKSLEDAAQVEDVIACMLRYGRAAEEGAARLNLRLMASAMRGMYSHSRLIASEFLYYADVLASLKREEVILLGVLHRNTKTNRGRDWGGSVISDPSIDELVPSFFLDENEYVAWCIACMRTGLVVDSLDMNAPRYGTSIFMDKLVQYVDFEAVCQREASCKS